LSTFPIKLIVYIFYIINSFFL